MSEQATIVKFVNSYQQTPHETFTGDTLAKWYRENPAESVEALTAKGIEKALNAHAQNYAKATFILQSLQCAQTNTHEILLTTLDKNGIPLSALQIALEERIDPKFYTPAIFFVIPNYIYEQTIGESGAFRLLTTSELESDIMEVQEQVPGTIHRHHTIHGLNGHDRNGNPTGVCNDFQGNPLQAFIISTRDNDNSDFIKHLLESVSLTSNTKSNVEEQVKLPY